MSAQTTTKKAFTCNLVTIRSKKSFGEVTNAIETMFQYFDLDKLRKLVETKDARRWRSTWSRFPNLIRSRSFLSSIKARSFGSLAFRSSRGFTSSVMPRSRRACSSTLRFRDSEHPSASAFLSVMGTKRRGSTSMSPAPSSASFRNSRPPAFRRSWTRK